MKRNDKGQALLLVIAAMGIFLFGAVGMAVDGAQLYAHRQMAQAAADAAAQAGLFSIFAGTKTTLGASHTCSTTDTDTACVYARNNGFGGTAADTVVISFPGTACGSSTCFNGVTSSPNPKYPHPFEQVTITRTVNTTFMGMLGTSSSTVKAIGAAGIVQSSSPVPILVLDPTGSPSLSLSGNPNIVICGGPQRSIQVNSNAAGAININGNKATIDLHKAGPADSGACDTGTGGDLGVFGGTAGFPSWLTPTGSTEHYVKPAAPINDPLRSISPPAKPGTNGTETTSGFGTNAGEGDCPTSAGVKGCHIFGPGYYKNKLEVKNFTGIFQPGIYYLDSTFSNAANGDIIMCSTTCVADTSGCCANNGVLIYLSSSAGAVSVGSNSNATMLGSSAASPYLGMLFFVDRAAADQSPSFGGGGNISLTGTIYMPTQTLSISGNSSNATLLKGEIIVNDLSLGGGGTMTMQLDPAYKLPIDQIALIK